MSENQIFEKLDSIQKNQKESSAKTNASIGFAVAAFVASNDVIGAEVHMTVVGAIIILIGLAWAAYNTGVYLRLRKTKQRLAANKLAPDDKHN